MLSFPSPGDLSGPGTEPMTHACKVNYLPLNYLGSPFQIMKSESVSTVQCFGALWTSPPDSFVHEILQARILELVAMPFIRVSSQTRDWILFSYIAGRLFPIWATREAQLDNNIFLMCNFDQIIFIILFIKDKFLRNWSILLIVNIIKNT